MLSNETFILFLKEEMLGKILTMKQVKIKWTYWYFVCKASKYYKFVFLAILILGEWGNF